MLVCDSHIVECLQLETNAFVFLKVTKLLHVKGFCWLRFDVLIFFFFISQGVTTVVEVRTLLLSLFCPMEHHHSWFLSEFCEAAASYCDIFMEKTTAHSEV